MIHLDATDYTDSMVAELRVPDVYTNNTGGVEELADFAEGDVVEVDGEKSVITAKMTESFEWPGLEDEEEVEASEESPMYIVARMSGGAKPVPASALTGSSFEDEEDEEDPDPKKLVDDAELANIYSHVDDVENLGQFRFTYSQLANIPGVDDPETGFSSLPNGWNRGTVLKVWAKFGGTWTGCHREMTKHKGPAFSKRFCSAMKDEVLQTEMWRGKF